MCSVPLCSMKWILIMGNMTEKARVVDQTAIAGLAKRSSSLRICLRRGVQNRDSTLPMGDAKLSIS